MKLIPVIASIATLSALIAPMLFAQQEAAAVREKTEKAHLVGHEDELLLKRIDDAIAEWDPRNLQSPYLREIGREAVSNPQNSVDTQRPRYAIRRPDLLEFIADPDAAVALGKALFWEMQAGSDSGLKDQNQKILGTACASCHFRFGADSRGRNTEAIAYPAWEKFALNRTGVTAPAADQREWKPPFIQRALPFAPNGEAPINLAKFSNLAEFKTPGLPQGKVSVPGLLQHEIVGSAGMFYRKFDGWDATTKVEKFRKVALPTDGHYQRVDMFVAKGEDLGIRRSRQVTQRNSPTVVNAVFNNRQFHDGRAESTFNGFSVFGDFDHRVILKKAFFDSTGKTVSFVPATVALVNASLASQAVGPIVNEVEMSYQGRTFHDLAVKLLPTRPLRDQVVSPTDCILSPYVKAAGVAGLYDPQKVKKADARPEDPPEIQFTELTYRTLIKRAFRKEWWADDKSLLDNAELQKQFKEARELVIARVNALVATQIGQLALQRDLTAKLEVTTPPAPVIKLPAAAILQKIDTDFPGPSKVGDKDNRPAEVLALRAAAVAWNDMEAQILPLRLYAPVDRTALDERLASIPTGPDELTADGDLMVNNFSLYWGISIMLYESTLISNRSPFDEMMRGDGKPVDELFKKLVTLPVATDATEVANDQIRKAELDKLITDHAPPTLTGTAMFQRGFRVFVRNCAECHEPPFFTAAADLELAPELPEPIAKMHTHSLIRTAMADAFKMKLIEANQKPGAGVTDANRRFLGARRFFFDQERIPELEATQQGLLIENMLIPDRAPVSFNTVAARPGLPPPPRVPMISWVGTRPALGFEPSPQDGEAPVAPYAFYDLGFYNLGVSEPRYDWGVWKFAMTPEEESASGVASMRLSNGLVLREEGVGLSSLGSAYTLPKRRFSTNSPATFAGPAAAELPFVDHSQERDYLNDPTHRGEMHFFKRARRQVMSEQPWGHRKPFITDNELAGWGAFKAPSLRNVALTAPYMHNGRFLTLRQVLKFYSFDNPDLIPANPILNPDLHPEMGRLAFDSDGTVLFPNGPTQPNIVQIQDAESLLFFLHCLTDERVAREEGPFDHPSIRVPNGFIGGDPTAESSFDVAEVGVKGRDPLPKFPSER